MVLKKLRAFLNSIQSTLVLYFIVLAVIPLAIVIYYTATELVNPRFEEESLQKMELVRNSRHESLEFWLDNAQSSLSVMLIDATQNQRMISLVSGPTLASTAPTTVRNLREFFSEQLGGNTFFTEIFIYDTSGEVVVSSNAENDGLVVNEDAYFAPSLTNTSVIQPPYYDPNQENMVMFMTIPITDSEGNQVGVLGGRVNLADLSKIFTDSVTIGDTDEVYLVSSAEKRFITPNRTNQFLASADSYGIVRGSAGLSGKSIYTNYDGQEVVGAYDEVPALDAIIIAEITTDEAFAVRREITNITLLISLLAILTAVAVGSYLAIAFAQPIGELTEVATQIAQGDLSQRTQIRNRNEIGRLAKAFNVMTDNLTTIQNERNQYIKELNTLNATLEQRVSEQTRDLQIAAEVSRQVTTILDMSDLLTAIVENTQAGFALYSVSAFLFDANTKRLNLVSGTGEAGKQALAENKHFHINDRGLVPLAGRKKASVVINDVTQSAEHFSNPLLPYTRSEVAIPMLFGGRLIGVLDFQSVEVEHFTDHDVQIFTTLAEQIAISVHNAQLFQESQDSRREAETANKIKSQFLASMSHELRTPLNGILNFTQFVSDGLVGDVNEKQVELLGQVISNGEHLLALINDILDISKIESNSLKLLITDNVDIVPEIEEVSEIAKTLLGAKSVEFKVEIEDNLPTVSVDRRRIRQIILNLVSNACKFTRSGHILLKAYQEDDDLMLFVQDTGVGIELHDQEAIFESFHQSEEGIRQGEGTGLGLPISRHLAQAHGGKLWVESELGKGSIFYVSLPIKQKTKIEGMVTQ